MSARDMRRAGLIIGECCELGADARAWQQHLLDAMRALLKAQLAIGSEMRGFVGGEPTEPLASVRIGWPSDEARRIWMRYVEEVPVEATPEYPRLVRASARGATFMRNQIWPKEAWYASRAFNEFHRASGMDDYIISICSAPRAGTVSSVWLHRPVDAPSFGRREWYLVHLIHSQIVLMIGATLASASEPNPSALSPRQQQVLGLLLEGASEKQIAARLSLSKGTVHDYVTLVYRHFEISSRGELLARFIGRQPPLPPAV